MIAMPIMTATKQSLSFRTRLLRPLFSLSSLTLLSRIFGLIREQVRAHLLGTSFASDAFGIAFQIPNLLRRLVGEGAMSAAFIPTFSRRLQQAGKPAAFSFALHYTNFFILILALICILGVGGSDLIVALFAQLGGHTVAPETQALTVDLTQIMFPYIALVSLAAIAQGILNTFQIFWVSALTSTFLNLSVIGSAIIFAAYFDEAVYGFAIGVLLGGVLQFCFQLPFLYSSGFRWSPRLKLDPHLRHSLLLLVPTIFGAGIYQINVVISQAIAWGLGPGAVSSLQYSSRLLEFTLGIFAVAISTAILPMLSSQVAQKQIQELEDTIGFALRLIILVCLPTTIVLLCLGRETVSILFERGSFDLGSTQETSAILYCHILGLTLIAFTRILVPVFYAFHDTWRPLWAAGVAMVINVMACWVLGPIMGPPGIALANTLSAFAHLLALAGFLQQHIVLRPRKENIQSILYSILATAILYGLLQGSQHYFELESKHGLQALFVPYTITLALGAAGFFATLIVLKHPEIEQIRKLLLRKR